MLQERIVITGIGLTSPLGNDLESFRPNFSKVKVESRHSQFEIWETYQQESAILNKPSIKKGKKSESVLEQVE